MAMCAYDEEYLPLAQRVLGDMLDYAAVSYTHLKLPTNSRV